MRYYVVPCGVSMLDGIRDRRGAPRDAQQTYPAIEALTLWARQALTRGLPVSLPAWWEAFIPHRDNLLLDEWRPEVCAETDTLYRRTRTEPPQLTKQGDPVVLLASETERGLLASMLVATLLAGASDERIYGDETGGSGNHPIRPGAVTVVLLRGLNPRVADGFAAATRGIGEVLRAVRDAAGLDRIDVHLSGGYKATLLHTLALTEILRSTAPEPSNVTAWYLPDSLGQTTHYDAVEIGLRTFQPEVCNVLRHELTAVSRHEEPETTTFEGSAWNRTYGRPALTAFGHGYLAILGPDRATRDG